MSPEGSTGNILRSLAVVGATAGSLILAGCGDDSPHLLPGVPGEVVDKYIESPNASRIAPSLGGSFLVIEQCGREDSDAGDDGCVEITVNVGDEIYDAYSEGSQYVPTEKSWIPATPEPVE